MFADVPLAKAYNTAKSRGIVEGGRMSKRMDSRK